MKATEKTQGLEIKPSRSKIKWLFLVIGLVLLIVVGYGVLAALAQERTLPFIKYQGKDVGLKTFAEVTKIVMQSGKQIKDEQVTLVFEGKEEKKKIDDLEISIQSSKTADAIFNFGKKKVFISLPSFSYFKDLITQDNSVDLGIKYSSNTEKKLAELFPDSRKDPANPSLSLDNGQLIINNGSGGAKIDINDFENKLENKLNGKLPGPIQLKKVETQSNFTASNVQLFLDEINNFINKQLYLQSDYKKMLVKKEYLLTFVDLERTILNQKFTISDQGINDYLNSSVSKNFNIKGRTREISTVDNSIIQEGTEGQQLDIQKSQENIKAALQNNSKVANLVVTTSPIEEEFISPGYNAGKYPGKYIEVNLSEQMLYTIDGTQLVGSYKVSTGKWSMPTPQGDFSINNKDPRAYSQEYNLYMPYWMSFIGSQYGIHELPEWADGTKEGEAHLGTPVSHGCIRLGRGSAQSVYDWTEIGTPVFVHL